MEMRFSETQKKLELQIGKPIDIGIISAGLLKKLDSNEVSAAFVNDVVKWIAKHGTPSFGLNQRVYIIDEKALREFVNTEYPQESGPSTYDRHLKKLVRQANEAAFGKTG